MPEETLDFKSRYDLLNIEALPEFFMLPHDASGRVCPDPLPADEKEREAAQAACDAREQAILDRIQALIDPEVQLIAGRWSLISKFLVKRDIVEDFYKGLFSRLRTVRSIKRPGIGITVCKAYLELGIRGIALRQRRKQFRFPQLADMGSEGEDATDPFPGAGASPDQIAEVRDEEAHARQRRRSIIDAECTAMANGTRFLRRSVTRLAVLEFLPYYADSETRFTDEFGIAQSTKDQAKAFWAGCLAAQLAADAGQPQPAALLGIIKRLKKFTNFRVLVGVMEGCSCLAADPGACTEVAANDQLKTRHVRDVLYAVWKLFKDPVAWRGGSAPPRRPDLQAAVGHRTGFGLEKMKTSPPDGFMQMEAVSSLPGYTLVFRS